MISPHAHISMTYQPPVNELKHVHRIEKKAREQRAPRFRPVAVARALRLAPRHA
jgi:hypothetical protein